MFFSFFFFFLVRESLIKSSFIFFFRMKKNGCHFLVNWNIFIRIDYFLFGLIFIKKIIKLKFKKKRNRFKLTDFDSVWFFRTKSVQTCFFRFWFSFFCFARFFSVRFQAYKTETELVGFFHDSVSSFIFF